MSQYPATSSLASVNGPSMTRGLPPANWTRAPLALACRPARSSRAPAFFSSSLYLPIAVSIFSSGSAPASDSLVALTSIMNRIVVSPFSLKPASRRVYPGGIRSQCRFG